MMKKLLLTLGVIALPSVAFAETIGGIFITIKAILDTIVPIVLTVAVIYFFWGVGKYMTATGDSEKQEEARGIMIYGIIGLFVMVAVWGLVGVLTQTFLGGNAPATPLVVPTVPTR